MNDSIFETIPSEALLSIAEYLKWDPIVQNEPVAFLSQKQPEWRKKWLDSHRQELVDQIAWVGTPIFSYLLGEKKSYREIAIDLAEQLELNAVANDDIASIEGKIVKKLWDDTLSRLTPEK